jgi:DNA-directed RNA polymerase subunit RPC12/RpoP
MPGGENSDRGGPSHVVTGSYQGTRLVFMNVTCPGCGQKCRVPESSFGQQVKCPACSKLFQCGSLAARSLETRPAPVQAAPQVRVAGSQPGQGVRYPCPRCAKPLESPVEAAGQKVNCPDCGQRLQIPQPAGTPTNVPVRIVASAPPPAPPPPVQEEVIPEALPAPEPEPRATVRREHCLECGVDVTDRERVHTCPDCGSTFCSAMCIREHRYHAHSSRR